MSPREVRGRDYATYVYSMYDDVEGAAANRGAPNLDQLAGSPSQTPAKPLKPPVRIAVAQLGEVAPPSEMIERLRKDSAAFASVQPASGVIDSAPAVRPTEAPQDYSTQATAKAHGERMRRFARDIGADYLFLYGGTIDRETTSSPLILANATVVGAFVVPGEVIQAQARATGSLIDVESGRVVLSVSADTRDRRRASSVAREGDEIKMLEEINDKLVAQLAEQLTARVKERSEAGG